MNSQSKSQMLDKFVPYYPTKDTRNFPIFSDINHAVKIENPAEAMNINLSFMKVPRFIIRLDTMDNAER